MPSRQDRRTFLQITGAGLVNFSASSGGSGRPSKHVDILVYDSTPAGITAAIAGAASGRSVLLITEDRHVGGMQTSGLGNTNAGQRATVGGLARQFHRRIHQYYVTRYGATSEQVQVCEEGFHFEPHVAETVYLNWLREVGVEVWTTSHLESISKTDSRIVSVELDQGRSVSAAKFIDASYEGDLLKLAGCSYHVGREGKDEYGESLAGVRYPPSLLGQADNKIQAYDFRLCLTDVKENQVSFWQPPNYDPSDYAFLLVQMKYAPPDRLHQVLPLNSMPNRKTDSRTGEWVGGSWEYPEGDRERRRTIEWKHRNYSAGYIWFLLTDPSVPGHIRKELTRWGLAEDEFQDNEHWPYHIYVREARRLIGDYVMTQADVTEERFKPDSVALGNFYLDVHPVQMVATKRAVIAEGWLGNPRTKPYEIPYRALLPQRTQAENLLVPVCLSASHVAFSTIRMEPVYMMLGHASGLAAAMSMNVDKPLHDLPMRDLQGQLRAQEQILDARAFSDVWPA